MAGHCDILLIFPPIRTWDNPRNFPTGIGLVAAELRDAGYRVAVIDANGLRLSDEEVLEKIRHYHPAVIGIGGLITTYGWVKRITARLRNLYPATPIVLVLLQVGGNEVTEYRFYPLNPNTGTRLVFE